MTTRSRIPGAVPALAACACAGIFYLLWETIHRGVFSYSTAVYPIDDADEWRYTACSRLVLHGYQLFTQVFSAQPPLLFLSLSAGMRLAGDSITGARWTEIAFGAIALAATAWTAWQLAGLLAVATSTVLLVVSPGFLIYSHAVEAEGPMMALVTVSLGLVVAWHGRGTIWLAVVAGLVLAAAILIKLFALEALAPALWLLLFTRARRRRVSAAGVFLAAVVFPLGADLLLLVPKQQWDQVVVMHDRAAQAPGIGASSAHVLGQFLTLDLGLTVLALGGLVSLAVLRRWTNLGFLLLWSGGTLTMLLLFHPLFPHHPAILLTGLAVAAGVGLSDAWNAGRQRVWRPAVPVAIAALVYLALSPRIARDDRHVLYGGPNPRVLALSDYVRSHTTSNAFVAADDPAVADLAGRLVPPPLCDPSNVRLRAGYLSAATLISATQLYRAALVVPSFGIYPQVAGYMRWVGSHYRHASQIEGVPIFARR